MNATPVSYEGSTILKASASFHYDRYYSGQSRSINEFTGDSNNLINPNFSGLFSQGSKDVYGASFDDAFNLPNDLGLKTSGS